MPKKPSKITLHINNQENLNTHKKDNRHQLQDDTDVEIMLQKQIYDVVI